MQIAKTTSSDRPIPMPLREILALADSTEILRESHYADKFKPRHARRSSGNRLSIASATAAIPALVRKVADAPW
jgi:hypothetical protein